MCGIGGVFTHHAGDSIDPQLLVNMAAIQAHRGPDGFGYQIHDSGVGMTHARSRSLISRQPRPPAIPIQL